MLAYKQATNADKIIPFIITSSITTHLSLMVIYSLNSRTELEIVLYIHVRYIHAIFPAMQSIQMYFNVINMLQILYLLHIVHVLSCNTLNTTAPDYRSSPHTSYNSKVKAAPWCFEGMQEKATATWPASACFGQQCSLACLQRAACLPTLDP